MLVKSSLTLGVLPQAHGVCSGLDLLPDLLVNELVLGRLMASYGHSGQVDA